MTEPAAEPSTNGRPSWRDVLFQLNLVEQRLDAKISSTEDALSSLIENLDKRLADFEVEEAIRARRTHDLMAIIGGARGLTLTVVAVGGLFLGIINLAN